MEYSGGGADLPGKVDNGPDVQTDQEMMMMNVLMEIMMMILDSALERMIIGRTKTMYIGAKQYFAVTNRANFPT